MMKNFENIEKEILEYYPGYKVYRSEFEFKDSIHTQNLTLENKQEIKLRFYSPSHKGDSPSLFYFVYNV